MKKFAIIFLLALTVIAVNAKEDEGKSADTENTATLVLSGTVADQNSGESLVGVEVKLEGTDLKTYTDFDGKFSFKNVKPGEYKLVTNYISYQKQTEVLEVNSKQNELKIKLQASN
ncbi:MAG TPA: carboxypeptidase-like regulatory domain-containing protein [Draconibacterium sp.]|nr:carboxypeptidase-like regulatory domain-containing protein [Draconibacterium sp.]HRX11095.1 carboxypeptidase-like regulatory domain-containing protein [Draconibacterium sp.]